MIHSGKGVHPSRRAWRERVVPSVRIGTIHLQGLRRRDVMDVDANIIMFDLHWPVGITAGLCLKRSSPVIWWGQGLGRRSLGRRIRAVLAVAGDGIILYAPSAREEMVEAGVSPHRVSVATNTIWVNKPRDTSAAPKNQFIFVGRLQARKRVGELIRAFARVHRSSPYNLLIVGGGEQRDELIDLAKSQGVDTKVRFTGPIHDESILSELFRQSVAYVSPGAVGLGVLHAFAYGVPVITARSQGHGPEVEWIVDGETGLFTDGTIRDLSTSLLRLSDDREWARQLGRRAFELYQRNATPEHMLQGFENAVRIAVG